MNSTSEHERLVRPSDLRGHRARHSRRARRRGWLGALSDAIVAALNGFVV